MTVTQASVPELDVATMSPGLSLRGVRASYGRMEALYGVDPTFPASIMFALFGPNGARKSTLLEVIEAQVPATAGEVAIGDRPVRRISIKKPASRLCSIPKGRGNLSQSHLEGPVGCAPPAGAGQRREPS